MTAGGRGIFSKEYVMSPQSPPALTSGTVLDRLCGHGWTSARGQRNVTPAHYRHQFGWIVHEVDGSAYLSLRHGMVGVAMPPTRAGEAVNALRSQGSRGPVLEVGTGAPVWVVLADPNGRVLSEPELPAGIRVLGCSTLVPLPGTSSRPARWIVPPDVHHRWLPTLDAVLAAVRAGHPSARDRRTRHRTGKGVRHVRPAHDSGLLRCRPGNG